MNRLPFIATVLLSSLLLMGCDNDEDTTPEIVSFQPTNGVYGDTILLSFDRPIQGTPSVQFGSSLARTVGVEDNDLLVVVPLLEGGSYEIAVEVEQQLIRARDNFEYLAFSFGGTSDKVIDVHPKNGANDVLEIFVDNPPKELDGLSIYQASAGSLEKSFADAFQAIEVTDDRIRFAVDGIIFIDQKYFLRVTGGDFDGSPTVRYYELTDLKFRGFYQLDDDIESYPGDVLILREGNRKFADRSERTSNVFLGDTKLEFGASLTAPTNEAGFGFLYYFKVPSNIIPGEYELTVFEEDGITQILQDPEAKITISDIAYCIDRREYSKEDTIRVVVDKVVGASNVSEPSTVRLWDVTRENSFHCRIAGTSLFETDNGLNTYIDILIVDAFDIPTNAIYSLELATDDGYEYKTQEGCVNAAIMLLP